MAKKSKKSPKKEPEIKEIVKSEPNGTDIISKLVLLASLGVVLILLAGVVFPALYSVLGSEYSEESWHISTVDPWETGALAAPLIIINAIIFGIGAIVYKKNSQTILNLISKIQSFEVSKKITIIVVIILLIIYIASATPELATVEQWDDFKNVQKNAESWSIDDTKRFDIHIRHFLLSLSITLFDNIRVIPFLASISLLVLTFFITKKITGKRLPGIISMSVIMQSNIFLSYDTTATYTNFWITFYLLSLYLVYKRWQFSALSFLVSIPTKTLTFAFFPMSLFFIYRANVPRKQKIYTLISYGILIGIILVTISVLNVNLTFGQTDFLEKNFMPAFSSIASQLRLDGFVVVFLLPVIVGLFLSSKRGLLTADSISILISGSIMLLPLVVTFTSQTTQPYRLVPLIVFFAIGVGMLFSKIKTKSEL